MGKWDHAPSGLGVALAIAARQAHTVVLATYVRRIEGENLQRPVVIENPSNYLEVAAASKPPGAAPVSE